MAVSQDKVFKMTQEISELKIRKEEMENDVSF